MSTNAPAARSAVVVLQYLAEHAEPVPAAAIARDVGLPRSSVYHLLAVLKECGFVTHLPEERRYTLGIAAFELGSAYTRQAPLQRIARPILARLVDSTTHNGHLVALHGRDVVYLLEERAAGRPALVTDVGVRLPAHLPASGMALLAALPAAQVRALYPDRSAFTQRHGIGASSLTALRSELSQVRTRGYAIEDGQVTPGFASVAAAALDHQGHPVAGIALTYESESTTDDERNDLARAVGEAADALTKRLGGERPSTPLTLRP